jgi:murein DD-endopeptidase MepM/ murein hydrolase activator NlpD
MGSVLRIVIAIVLVLLMPGMAEAGKRRRKAPRASAFMPGCVAEKENTLGYTITPPVQGVKLYQIVDTFCGRRSDRRTHQAIDLHLDKFTPILAAVDGTIHRMGWNDRGGWAIWLYDKDDKFLHYYSHLEGYADGVQQGMQVSAGQMLGYLGNSGNAENTDPHLHYQISELGPSGDPSDTVRHVNPWPVLYESLGGDLVSYREREVRKATAARTKLERRMASRRSGTRRAAHTGS